MLQLRNLGLILNSVESKLNKLNEIRKKCIYNNVQFFLNKSFR